MFHDLLGLYPRPSPSFAKPYAQLGETAIAALRHYRSDVAEKTFPGQEHTFQ